MAIKHKGRVATYALAMAGLAATLTGCGGGAADMFSRDADWFSSRNSLFRSRTLSVENQSLSSTRPVSPEDLVSADGTCLGMSAPAAPRDSNAQARPSDLAPGGAPADSGLGQGALGGVALGMTECEVARSEGVATSTEIGANAAGDREVTLTYLGGARPGIYKFTAGRLSSIDRAPEPARPERPARKQTRKPAAKRG